MNVRLFLSLVLMVLLPAAEGAVGAADERSAFALRDAVVVYEAGMLKATDGGAWNRLALAELTNALSRVTGAPVSACAEGQEPKGARRFVYLGRTQVAKEADLSVETLRNGDWTIRIEPSRVFVFARHAWGLTQAVTDFAERELDYHVAFIEGDDVYSVDPDRRLACGERTVCPAVYDRSLYHGRSGADYTPEVRRARDRFFRLHGFVGAGIEGKWRLSGRCPPTHTAFKYLPPEKHFKDHPEYFALGPDGKRHGKWNDESQICWSNPDAYRIVLDSLRGFVRADRAANPSDPSCVYDFSVMTYCNWMCWCDACKEKIAKYNRVPGGHEEGGDAGLMLEYANRLARDIRAEHPDVKIQTLFEVRHLKTPPKPGTIVPEPNVWIYWRKDYGRTDHTQPFARADHFNRDQAAEFSEWRAIAPEIRIWDAIYNGFGRPEPLVDALAENARYFGACRLEGSMAEMQYRGQPFYDLNCYLMARLYADPTLDVDTLVGNYCRGYGPAEKAVRESLAFLRAEMRRRPSADVNGWFLRDLPWADEPTLARFYAPLRAACDEQMPYWPRRRLARLVASTAKARLAYLRTDPEARALCDEMMSDCLRFSVGLPERPAVEREFALLNLRFADLPKGLEDRQDLKCFDANVAGHARADASSERGKAVVCANFGGFPIPCGVYDRKTRHFTSEWQVTAEQVPEDGAYHWVRLGETTLMEDSVFWFPKDWSRTFVLKDKYVRPRPGKLDPNRGTLYCSMKLVNGELFVDRLVLAPGGAADRAAAVPARGGPVWGVSSARMARRSTST